MGIDKRVAQYPVEPRHRTLVILDRRGSLHCLDVSRLECIARSLLGPESRPQESEKFALPVQQRLGQAGDLLHATSAEQFTSAWRCSSRAKRFSSAPVLARGCTRTIGCA